MLWHSLFIPVIEFQINWFVLCVQAHIENACFNFIWLCLAFFDDCLMHFSSHRLFRRWPCAFCSNHAWFYKYPLAIQRCTNLYKFSKVDITLTSACGLHALRVWLRNYFNSSDAFYQNKFWEFISIFRSLQLRYLPCRIICFLKRLVLYSYALNKCCLKFQFNSLLCFVWSSTERNYEATEIRSHSSTMFVMAETIFVTLMHTGSSDRSSNLNNRWILHISAWVIV